MNQYNNSALELEQVDFSDTTGLLDTDQDDWEAQQRRNNSRQSRTFAILPQSAKITYGFLVMLFIFAVGCIMLISYRLFFKRIDPEPDPVLPPTPPHYSVLLKQDWIPTLCVVQAPCPYTYEIISFFLIITRNEQQQLGFTISQFRSTNESLGFCHNAIKYNSLPSMQDDVNKYWSDEQVRKTEFESHGKCMPNASNAISQENYFERALELRKKYNFMV